MISDIKLRDYSNNPWFLLIYLSRHLDGRQRRGPFRSSSQVATC